MEVATMSLGKPMRDFLLRYADVVSHSRVWRRRRLVCMTVEHEVQSVEGKIGDIVRVVGGRESNLELDYAGRSAEEGGRLSTQ